MTAMMTTARASLMMTLLVMASLSRSGAWRSRADAGIAARQAAMPQHITLRRKVVHGLDHL
jgi:hypothetical protein